MSSEFLKHADLVLQSIDKEKQAEKIKEDSLFIEIKELIDNVNNSTFPDKKLRLSFSAFNLQDDEIIESDQLIKDIIHLEELYKVIKRSNS